MKNKCEPYRDKWESDLGSRRDNPLEGAGGLFALISLLGFQAIIKQICFLLPSLPPAPSLSLCSSYLFSKQPCVQQHQHLLPELSPSANGITCQSSQHLVQFFPLLLSGSPCQELVALSQAALAGLLGTGPSYCQRRVLDFLKRVVEQTPPNGLRFSLRS